MAELTVSKKSIQAVFTTVLEEKKCKKFLIPEYQRPYSWDKEKCDILWNDILDHHNGDDSAEQYFLGSIVVCPDEEDKEGLNVIDGQQRITSFMLLLRAFYKKLEAMNEATPDDDEVTGLLAQIAPCIWDVNKMSKKVTDKSKIHITSKVASDDDNEAFHYIMINGEPKKYDKSKYAENYNYFMEQCDNFAKDHPMQWKQFCLCILNDCIVLPIECDNLEAALIIFNTLNDRGMPLSDSDIFKAEIYKSKGNKADKDAFTEQWKELDSKTKDIKENTGIAVTIDDIFRYYTHIIRSADAQLAKTKEIGLRKFYAKDSKTKKERLHKAGLMDDLLYLADCWYKLLKYDDSLCTEESKKFVNCLVNYPNEFWKYPVTVFFDYCRRNNQNIKANLPELLKKLSSYLFVKFVESPTVNAIKDPVYAFCAEIYNNGKAAFGYTVGSDFEKLLYGASNTKITRSLLLLNSYLYDNNSKVFTGKMEIEHIFPQTYDTAYFTWTDAEAKEYLNQFGNKVPFEKKLNIKASNGFYSKKKLEYQKSKNKEVLDLCNFTDWTKDSIKTRTTEIVTRLVSFFRANLSASDVTKTILQYKSGSADSTAEIQSVTKGGKTTFKLSLNGNSSDYDSLAKAINTIEIGLLKYGTPILISPECKKQIDKIIGAQN